MFDITFNKNWENELRNSIDINVISDKLNINKTIAMKISNQYPVRITPHYFSLINWNDPNDPLLRIVVPDSRELRVKGLSDQSGETVNTTNTGVPGLQHKYGPTALLLISGTCAAYCRFCFRRRFVGTQTETVQDLDRAFAYIKKHPEINNILLSGGDSFMVSNDRLEYILKHLNEIKHVRSIRFGTKMGVYLPSRFEDQKLLELLEKYNNDNQRIYIISHIDHPRELDKRSRSAHKNLLDRGITILSQSVFLKGVNDNPKVLIELFSKIAKAGIRPYYLFQCRPVKGAIHFHVPLLDGFNIIETAKKNLNGLEKTFRFMMSHVSGKIEIINVKKEDGERIATFRYHQARDPRFLGEIMMLLYKEPAYWLDDVLTQTETIILAGATSVDYAKRQMKLLVSK